MSFSKARLSLIATVALSLVFSAVAAPMVAQAATPGVLTITNSDPAPSNSRIVLSRIQTPADSFQRTHDQTTVRLTNTGGTSFSVDSIVATTNGTTTKAFTASSPWAIPFRLAAGAAVDITVKFTATFGAWYGGNLAVNSSLGTKNVELVGYWQQYSEHNLEPRLPDLVSHFGYTTVMPSAIYSRGAYVAYSKDEVLTPYWTRFDTTQPARVTQLAAWHGYASSATFRTFPKGSPSSYSTVLTTLKFDAQSALPRNSAWGKGTATFSPSGTFGLILDAEYSDPKLNNSAIDKTNGCMAAQCGQHVRVFKAVGGGAPANSYIVVDDIQGINYDYQDNVYLVSNIKPAA